VEERNFVLLEDHDTHFSRFVFNWEFETKSAA